MHDRDTLAFLQYTSGSTATPKGVMITHGNLLAQFRPDPATASARRPESRGVFWLPLFHDMGLIGGVIQTIYCGGSSTLFSPVSLPPAPDPMAASHLTHQGDDQRGAELRLRSLRGEDDARAARRSGPELLASGLQRRRADPPGDARPLRRRHSPRPASAGRRFCPVTAWPRRRCSSRAVPRAPRRSSSRSTPRLSGAARSPSRAKPARASALPAAARSPPVIASSIVDPDPDPVRRGSRRRDLGLGAERRAGLLGAARGDGGDSARQPERGRRGAVPQDRRPRLPEGWRALRHRPAQGPDHPPRPKRLSPGHRVDGGAVPSRAPAGGAAAFAVEVDGEERLAIVQEIKRHSDRAVTEEVIAAIRQAIARAARHRGPRDPVDQDAQPPQDIERESPAPRLPRGFPGRFARGRRRVDPAGCGGTLARIENRAIPSNDPLWPRRSGHPPRDAIVAWLTDEDRRPARHPARRGRHEEAARQLWPRLASGRAARGRARGMARPQALSDAGL